MWVTLIFVSGPSGGADDVSFGRAPERLQPLHVEACRSSFFLCNITGQHRLDFSRSQSGRRSADVRTRNRPDARLRIPRAKKKQRQRRRPGALFQSSKRQSEYQGYRGATPDRIGNAMPVLIGATMIAAAILLSTLITAVGTRFAGMESPNEENLWLIDRLTGSVYRCQAPERGKAACEAEVATGSLGERPKH